MPLCVIDTGLVVGTAAARQGRSGGEKENGGMIGKNKYRLGGGCTWAQRRKRGKHTALHQGEWLHMRAEVR